MLRLDAVTEHVRIGEVWYSLAEDASVVIPPGRYALLFTDAVLGPHAVDLLAGTKPPRRGRVFCAGNRSWAIGRSTILYGAASGGEVVSLISRLYGLDRQLCESVITRLLTFPGQFDGPMSRWTPLMRREFLFGLGLLPQFDVYFVEGPPPTRGTRFPYLWSPLFGERLLRRMLIMSDLRPASEFTKYCDKALIFDRGRIFIEPDLAAALERYHSVAQALEGSREDQMLDEEDADL